MFSCCVRHFRPKQEDHTADNDCRWKIGERTGTFARGDHHESDDYPGGLRPPIFYLDSGDSTDTDAPNPLQTIRQASRNDSDVNTTMTSQTKLDPNSQLQRKSKLHNEKLPSFSALDRTKRPRARREDSGAIVGDNTSLVFEPLTFDTFRSNSPPLAVIAPLSKPKSHLQNNGPAALGPKIYAPREAEHGIRTNSADPGTETCSQTNARPAILLKKSLKGANGELVTHQSCETSSGGCHLQDKSRIIEGYSSDEKPFASPTSLPSNGDRNVAIPTSPARKTKVRKRPTTLQLPSPNRNSSFPSRNSASTFEDGTSDTDSDVDSDALRITVNAESSRKGTNGSKNPDYQEHLPNTGNTCNLDNCLVRKVNDNSEGADQTPKIVSTGKKIPPKKPKRKNPPSNASSGASRRAITTCLTSKREREVVSSSESDRQSDVDRQSVFHDECRMDKELVTPPHPFLDHAYAGFESFDEVNGSLV